jgi:hypothetical protein
MVTAVQAAVVAAAAAWVIGVGVAVYVMLKAARLMSETSTTVAGLRQRGDLLIERANAAIDRAGEQIAKTEAVTASIEGVTATMSELDGHLTTLAPPAATGADAPGRPLTWAAALVYGIRWALRTRWARAGTPPQARPGTPPQARPGTPPQARPGTPPQASPWAGREAGRRPALTGRVGGPAR